MKKLTGKQRRWLRGLGHGLSNHVNIATSPVSPSVRKETDFQLGLHELIKVKLAFDDRDERNEVITELAETLDAEVVQQLGKTALLYRPNPELEKPLRLPAAEKGA
jgi:RNA-binding protein